MRLRPIERGAEAKQEPIITGSSSIGEHLGAIPARRDDKYADDSGLAYVTSI